jgi:hypothetical protein
MCPIHYNKMSVYLINKNVIHALQTLILFPFFGDDNGLHYRHCLKFITFLFPFVMPELPLGSFIKHEKYL